MLSVEMTMGEALHDVARSRLTQEALICGDVRVTYGDLEARSAALARGLLTEGVGQGAKVVALLTPGVDFACLFFAVARLGAVLVPLNPQFRRRALGAVLADVQPDVLVTAYPVDDDLSAGLRHVYRAGEDGGDVPTLEGLVGAGGRADLSLPVVAPQDLLALLYTSGTTGTPKGTMHSHRSLIAPVVASIRLRALWTRRPNVQTLGKMAVALARYRERLLRAAGRPQTFLSTVGWHSITGLEVMLQALLMGDRLVVMPRFHPREALRLVQEERVTILVAVPTAFQVMVGLQAAERYDVSSLLICGTGSAPCPPELAREMQAVFGCAVHIGFGATETAGGIAATDLADSDRRQAETVGRPMPGMEIRIVDEQRCEVPRGQVGELACRSDSVMLGYYRAPEATAEVIDEQGWYYTGDLARMDEEGYLQIVGRVKDVIIRGGQNVYPAEIEIYLAAHPLIREAAVIGVPERVGGEAVWAFVLLEPGAEMTAREVTDYSREALEPYKIPARVRFVDDFPRTETGKPLKFRLREMAQREKGSE